ncbi:MAG: hypothetical protein QW041_02890 [Candidatus Pacearchaeota archaeon]
MKKFDKQNISNLFLILTFWIIIIRVILSIAISIWAKLGNITHLLKIGIGYGTAIEGLAFLILAFLIKRKNLAAMIATLIIFLSSLIFKIPSFGMNHHAEILPILFLIFVLFLVQKNKPTKTDKILFFVAISIFFLGLIISFLEVYLSSLAWNCIIALETNKELTEEYEIVRVDKEGNFLDDNCKGTFIQDETNTYYIDFSDCEIDENIRLSVMKKIDDIYVPTSDYKVNIKVCCDKKPINAEWIVWENCSKDEIFGTCCAL